MLAKRNYVTDVILGNAVGLVLSLLAVCITGHAQVIVFFRFHE